MSKPLFLVLAIVSSGYAQVFGTLVPATTYYVDQAAGSDNNDGSYAHPFQTLTKLQSVITAGQSAAINGGPGPVPYRYQEALTLPAANITIAGYGAVQPLIDCSDAVPANMWSKTAGYTSVYQATLTFNYEGFVRVWENGIGLPLSPSLAALDSTPGSFYVTGNTPVTCVPCTMTVYVNATGSGNPATNGNLYEYNSRAYSVFSNDQAIVSNLWTRRNLADSGSLEVGANSFLTDLTVEDGTKHNMLVHTGTTVQGTTVSNAYYAGQPLILLVYNDDSPNYEGLVFRRITATMPVYTLGPDAIDGHVNVGGNFGVILYDHVTVSNVQGGITDVDGSGLVVVNPTFTNVQLGIATYSSWVNISGATINALNWAIGINSPATVFISDSNLTGGVSHQGVVMCAANGVTLNISSTIINNTGDYSFGVMMETDEGNELIMNAGNGLIMNGNTFLFDPSESNAYALWGYSTFLSDHNTFPPGSTGSASIDDAWYTWAQLRANYGQETHSTP